MPHLFRTVIDVRVDLKSSPGAMKNILSSRDSHSTSQPIDGRSLGIGVIIGVLATLMLGSLISLLIAAKGHHRLRHLTLTTSHSSSRRHLVRSTAERFTIDEDTPPVPIHRGPPSEVVLDISAKSEPTDSQYSLSQHPPHALRTAHRLPTGSWVFSPAAASSSTTLHTEETFSQDGPSNFSVPRPEMSRTRSVQSSGPYMHPSYKASRRHTAGEPSQSGSSSRPISSPTSTSITNSIPGTARTKRSRASSATSANRRPPNRGGSSPPPPYINPLHGTDPESH